MKMNILIFTGSNMGSKMLGIFGSLEQQETGCDRGKDAQGCRQVRMWETRRWSERLEEATWRSHLQHQSFVRSYKTSQNCASPLASRKMQIMTTLRCLLTLEEMAKIKKKQLNPLPKNAVEDMGEGNPHSLFWETANWSRHYGNQYEEFSESLK